MIHLVFFTKCICLIEEEEHEVKSSNNFHTVLGLAMTDEQSGWGQELGSAAKLKLLRKDKEFLIYWIELKALWLPMQISSAAILMHLGPLFINFASVISSSIIESEDVFSFSCLLRRTKALLKA